MKEKERETISNLSSGHRLVGHLIEGYLGTVQKQIKRIQVGEGDPENITPL